MTDYYDILNLTKEATTNDIKRQYHRLAKRYHPDKNNDKNACQNFQRLSEAYQTLSNPKRRAIYDLNQTLQFTKKWREYLDIELSDEELLILYEYYESFSKRLEIRFLKILYKSLPKHFKEKMHEMWKQSESDDLEAISQSEGYALWDIKDIKSIDVKNLDETCHIKLLRSFEDTYHNLCKIVKIIVKERAWIIFITHSNYNMRFLNKKNYLDISILTHPSPHYHIDGDDIHVDIDKKSFQKSMKMLTQTLPMSLLNNPKVMIPYCGFRNPLTNRRGYLHIHGIS